MLPGLCRGLRLVRVEMRTLRSTFRSFFQLSSISRIGFLQSCIDSPSSDPAGIAAVVGEGLLGSDESVRGGVGDCGVSSKHHIPGVP
jgi:hypothetical protein